MELKLPSLSFELYSLTTVSSLLLFIFAITVIIFFESYLKVYGPRAVLQSSSQVWEYANTFLLRSKTIELGFTLIELLVVIAIIAVLAIMGFAAFTGLTGRGNDDRRQADLKAIADALEVKKGSSTTYQSIFATDFAAGAFPSEPTNRVEKYCFKDNVTSIANPTAASMVSATLACPATWSNVSGAIPGVSGTATYFKICTLNEQKNSVICRGSRQ